MRFLPLVVALVVLATAFTGCLRKGEPETTVVSHNDPFPTSPPDAAGEPLASSSTAADPQPASPTPASPEPEPAAEPEPEASPPQDETPSAGAATSDEANATADNATASDNATGNATGSANGNTTASPTERNETVSWETSVGYATCLPGSLTCPSANSGDRSISLGKGSVLRGQLVMTWEDDFTSELRLSLLVDGSRTNATVTGVSPLVLDVGAINLTEAETLSLSVAPACSGSFAPCATTDVDVAVDGWLVRLVKAS